MDFVKDREKEKRERERKGYEETMIYPSMYSLYIYMFIYMCVCV